MANQHKSSKLNLIILDLLNKGDRPSKICGILKIKKNSLQYYLSLLKKAGYIKKKGYGVWEVLKEHYDHEEIKEVQRTTQVTPDNMRKVLNLLKSNNSRGHAFMFHLKIFSKVKNWDKREEILIKKEIEFKKLNNFGGGQKLNFKGRKVHLKNKCIIIYETMNFLSEMASGANKLAIYSFLELIKSLEKSLGADFSIKGEYYFKVSKSHYSLIKNALAKQYTKLGKRLNIYNHNGLWMSTDNSFDLNELETIQNRDGEKRVIEQNEGMAKFMNEMDETNFQVTPKFVLSNFDETRQGIRKISENQIQFSQVMNQVSNNLINMGKEIIKIRLRLDK